MSGKFLFVEKYIQISNLSSRTYSVVNIPLIPRADYRCAFGIVLLFVLISQLLIVCVLEHSAGEGALGMAVLRSCICNRQEGLSARYINTIVALP